MFDGNLPDDLQALFRKVLTASLNCVRYSCFINSFERALQTVCTDKPQNYKVTSDSLSLSAGGL